VTEIEEFLLWVEHLEESGESRQVETEEDFNIRVFEVLAKHYKKVKKLPSAFI
jgi:hypothetical protein